MAKDSELEPFFFQPQAVQLQLQTNDVNCFYPDSYNKNMQPKEIKRIVLKFHHDKSALQFANEPLHCAGFKLEFWVGVRRKCASSAPRPPRPVSLPQPSVTSQRLGRGEDGEGEGVGCTDLLGEAASPQEKSQKAADDHGQHRHDEQAILPTDVLHPLPHSVQSHRHGAESPVSGPQTCPPRGENSRQPGRNKLQDWMRRCGGR